ncbi:MAG: GNAT family N-acetyltransferase [bacterium]|nr:GNAT family N-acetyltransferase [bacterium]
MTTRLAAHPAEEAAARLLTVADGTGAVVAVAVQTPPRKWIVVDAPVAAIAAVVDLVHAAGWDVPGVFGDADAAGAFAARWRACAGVTVRSGRRQVRYVLDRVAWRPLPRGHCRPATAAEGATLVAWTRAFAADVGDDADADEAVAYVVAALDAGLLVVWDDGGPAAMVRLAPGTPHLWRLALVYAPPERRRRGYTGALVAACCDARLAAGARWCTLSTERANRPANALYRRVGFRPAGDTIDWLFTP